MKTLFVVLLVAAMASGAAFAAPSFLGITGNILTPDDIVLSPGDFCANLHSFQNDHNSPLFIAAAVGATDGLELGIGHYDPDGPGDQTETFVNAKYAIKAETQSSPSVVIGATDLTGDLDPDDNPGFFILLGKNLTPVATDMTGEPSMPLRGTLGFGSGIYGGMFAALDWTLTPKVSLMAEYVANASIKGLFNEEQVVNIGARLAITNNLRADAALIDGKDFAFGISYTRIAFD